MLSAKWISSLPKSTPQFRLQFEKPTISRSNRVVSSKQGPSARTRLPHQRSVFARIRIPLNRRSVSCAALVPRTRLPRRPERSPEVGIGSWRPGDRRPDGYRGYQRCGGCFYPGMVELEKKKKKRRWCGKSKTTSTKTELFLLLDGWTRSFLGWLNSVDGFSKHSQRD